MGSLILGTGRGVSPDHEQILVSQVGCHQDPGRPHWADQQRHHQEQQQQLQQGDQSTYQEACVDKSNQHATRTHKSLVAQLVTVSECKLLGQGAVVVQLAWQFDMQSIQGSTPCP